MKYATLVFKNLTRNKRRTILTVASIAVSLFIFSALVSLPTVAHQILADNASAVRVVVHNRAGLTYPLPEAYRRSIAAIPHVSTVVAESWFGGIYHDVTDQFPNLAVDADEAEAMWPDWGATASQWNAFRHLRTGCLVGEATMKRFGLHIGQQIMLRGTFYPFDVTLKIVGVLSNKAPATLLIFRRDYLEEAAGSPGLVDNFFVRADRSQNVPMVIKAIDQKFANSSAETRSESEAAFFGGFLRSSRLLFQLAELLAVIVVIVIGLAAANTAAMSIRERRSEIAVLRSLGFSSRTVLALLLAEASLIGLLGGLLGCGLGFIALKSFAIAAPLHNLGTISMPPIVAAETVVAALTIGILSALIPAGFAARGNIANALRAVA